MNDVELIKAYNTQRAYELLFEAGYFGVDGEPIGGACGAEIFGRVSQRVEMEWSQLQVKDPQVVRSTMEAYLKAQGSKN